MLQRIIGLIFRGRHYWRKASFDEVAELYTSRLIMIFALNLMGLFMALYLYKLGYTVIFISLLYAALYVFKIIFAPLAAKYIAYCGPKHGVLFANILRIPSLAAMFVVQDYGLWAIIVYGVFQQMAACLYAVSYLVDFSKVRHAEHTGKELGMMQLIERGARVASPLLGGVLATTLGPSWVIFITAFLVVLSSLPLLRTMEPTTLKTKINWQGFPWRFTRRSFVAELGVGFDIIASGMVWTLFCAIAVFSSYGQGVYAAFGVLASIGVLVSMLAAWLFGKLVDRRHGDLLFTTGVVANSVIHAFRPFTAAPADILGVNTTNETATSAYVLPWTRAVFDIADSTGFRIAYMTVLQMFDDAGSLIACLLLAATVWLFGAIPGMQLFFVGAAFFELIILVGRRYAR